MKKINNIDLTVSAGRELENYKGWIDKAETIERTKAVGNAALGFINGMNMTVNAMICTENNEFTGDFGEWLDEQKELVMIAVKQKCLMLVDAIEI